ncbi:MAG: NUDIX hydrolase [Magnetococcales bacterium]|nr:NUDIX hydrolase [Magnetococcales bacterium]MBF0438014.1 NUDIX hydrolase [Magnetococcales bacterium]
MNTLICPHLQPVETLHTNPWFALRNRGGYYTIEESEAQGAILPIVERHWVVMVRVKRPLINDCPLELPAGGIARNLETPQQGMRRELEEETGIFIDNLARIEPLHALSIFPNRHPCRISLFQVDLTQEEFDNRKPPDDEIEEVVLLSRKQLTQMIQSGEIYVMLAVAVISRWLLEPI